MRGEQHSPAEPWSTSNGCCRTGTTNRGTAARRRRRLGPLPQEFIRARLTETLYGCGTAKAVQIVTVIIDGQKYDCDGPEVEIHDPIDRIAGELLATEDAWGELCLRPGPASTPSGCREKTPSCSWLPAPVASKARPASNPRKARLRRPVRQRNVRDERNLRDQRRKPGLRAE